MEMIFGRNIPVWLPRLVGIVLAVGLILLAIWGGLLVLVKIIRLWKDDFWPLFYDKEQKRRVVRRQRFADHVESEIRRINNLEIWSDYRFAELEAEVEAEGRRRALDHLPFAPRTQSGLRRERSLSKALEASKERLILVEGDPGSGKSVALRYVTQVMAKRAMKARTTRCVIPIYINLKELVRHSYELANETAQPVGESDLQQSTLGAAKRSLVILEHEAAGFTSLTIPPALQIQLEDKRKEVGKLEDELRLAVQSSNSTRPELLPIDTDLIRSFILKSLNRANDRDIEEFLETEFDVGLDEGTWLFLFDSFDELPEVLSSTEADTTIREYGDAIYGFLHGMNKCRGVVASRQFRGPGQFGWPRFRIVPLSEERQLELIRKFELKSQQEREIIGQLGTTTNEIRVMASNPMFLALLCEHVKNEHPFPENAHSVFETYISTRLST